MHRLARRIAAAWGYHFAQGGWAPPIPDWVFERFSTRYAFDPGEEKVDVLKEAKESIHTTLPRFIALLKKETGDRYHMNSSTRRHELYYFFSPRYPIDTYSLYVRPQGDKVLLVMGYVPVKLNGSPDYTKAVEVKGPANPMSAGLVMMMLTKQLLQKVQPKTARRARLV